jgi:DNA-binding response OmpR family regulator
MNVKILLIEDDEPIAEVVKQGLEDAYYSVDVAAEGPEGLRLAQEGDYALLIVDIMLPGMDGLSITEALRRSRSPLPVLMLTARDALDDRVRGLEAGADDYLGKPFEFPELLARVRALLRRDKVQRTRIVQVLDLEVDTVSRRVTRAGQEILLTPREYALLEALVTREGTVLTREFIQERVWLDDESYSNTVDVCIAQLRKKVDSAHEAKLIQTVHRAGYTIKRPDGDD